MKKLLLTLLLFAFAYSTKAQETIYGGIPAPRYLTTSEVIWFQTTNALTQTIGVAWTYTMQCKGGSPSGSAYIYNSGNVTLSTTAGTGIGFGQLAPCNGWLIQTTFGVSTGSTMNSQLYEQSLIMSSVPCAGGLVPNGAFSIVTSCNIVQTTIEQCLTGVNANSFYTYSYPGIGCSPPTNGPGVPNSVIVSNPASATNFQQALNTFYRHRIINVQYTLTTSSAGGNRFACLNWLTGGVSGTVVGRNCSRYAQQPSSTVVYNFANAVGGYTNCSFMGGTQTAVQCPEMDVPIAQYWDFSPLDTAAINSAVVNELGAGGLQTGDTITNITIRELIWNEID